MFAANAKSPFFLFGLAGSCWTNVNGRLNAAKRCVSRSAFAAVAVRMTKPNENLM